MKIERKKNHARHANYESMQNQIVHFIKTRRRIAKDIIGIIENQKNEKNKKSTIISLGK